jgi:hypothetical protein
VDEQKRRRRKRCLIEDRDVDRLIDERIDRLIEEKLDRLIEEPLDRLIEEPFDRLIEERQNLIDGSVNKLIGRLIE